MNKFLILLFYYNRPNMVRNALRSIEESTYKNYHVAFIDDSDNPFYGYKVVDEFRNRININHVGTNDTDEQKALRGGSMFGWVANNIMKDSTDCNIAIMLCDDDFLKADYLENLNNYFNANPAVNYCYSHIILFNPLEEKYEDVKDRNLASNYLNWTQPINPFCQVDSSQVAWRIDKDITFPYPQTSNLDAAIYSKMFAKWGECVFSGFIGQLKGWFPDQLGKRANTYGVIDCK